MGTKSINHPPNSTHATLRIAFLFLLSLASSLTASAQTPAITVPLLLPSAIVFDAAGNLYLAETAHHVIRKIDTSGNITTIAGTGTQGFSGDSGPAPSATLDSPQGLALDAATAPKNLYIDDTHNHRIRKLNLTTGTITTIAGTGTPGFSGDNALATAAQLNLPTALAVDSAGNLYLADTGNHRIRKISVATGSIASIAGTGLQGFSGDNALATAATIDSPTGLALDAKGNLYLADTHNQRIRRIAAATGIITTIAGNGASGFSGETAAASTATLALPHGLALDPAGNLYFADTANHRIRRIDASTGIITTVAGDGTQAFSGDGGPAIAASLDTPRSTAISPSAALLTLADTGNHRVRQLTAAPAPSTTIQTIAGLGFAAPSALTLTAPPIIGYGTGQLTATLASNTAATGVITFFDTIAGTTTAIGTSSLVSNIAILSASTLSARLHNITAAYAGDQTHTTTQSATLAVTITPQALTATVFPTTLVYGQPIPSLTGNLAGVLPQDAPNLSATFITTASALSSTGAYPITATLTGPAAGNYSIPTPAATLTINPAPTVLTISNLIATAAAGSSINLTAHLSSSTSAATFPGTISILDGGIPLFALPLSSTGDAVFTISSITRGSHSFTAFYSGSPNFTPSTSAPQIIAVGGDPPITGPDFTLTVTGLPKQTILSGNSVDYTFAVQLQGAMSSPITLAATGLPNSATAAFNPPTLPPGTPTRTFILTVSTSNITTVKSNSTRPPIAWAFLFLPIATLMIRPRSTRMPIRLLPVILLSLVTIFAIGCGDRINSSNPLAPTTKTYTITVTGTATTSTGSILQHAATVTLLLEQPQ